MKITIEKKAALAAFGKVTGVVEGKNTIPILSNVMLLVDGDRLSLTATDLDMQASVEIDAANGRKGSITAPASLLSEIFRKLPDGADAELSYVPGDDPRLLVRAGRGEFKLPVLPAGDFPIFNTDGLTWGGEIDGPVLAELLAKTAVSISTEETRYYLNGLYIHVANEGGQTSLRCVSTDGHRLSLAQAPLPEGFVEGRGVIVPRKMIRQMSRLLGDGKGWGKGDVVLRLGDNKVQLRVGDAVLSSKTIDGAFPDYQRVIPRDNGRVMIIDRKLLLDAAERVSIVSAEKSKSLKMSLSVGALNLMVRNMEAGQASEVLEADFDGEDLQLGFNARYLTDALGLIEADAVEFRFADPASPALAIDSERPDNRFVLMPLRV